jgi:hypothetical protein
MFQWFYDFFMAYLMPLVLQIADFLGIDMSKKVHFEDETQKGGSDVPPSASASAAALASGFLSDAPQE